MAYGIQTINSSGVVTFDPANDAPMTYVGTYTMPSYTAPSSASVSVSGIAPDDHWFILSSVEIGIYTSISIGTGVVTSVTTSPATGTIPSFTFDVYRDNSTSAPTSGFGCWVKNDSGFISAQTNNSGWAVYQGPTQITGTFNIPTSGLPSGAIYAAIPVPASGSTRINFNFNTSPQTISSSSGVLEYIVLCPFTSIAKDTTGYGMQFMDSSGNMVWSGAYRQVKATKNVNFAVLGGTAWSMASGKKAYVLCQKIGFRTTGLQSLSPTQGFFMWTLATWDTDSSGNSQWTPRAVGPPVDATGSGTVYDVFVQITG